ncbi:serine O-acetyltransferase [Algoriphagus aquimarinus]|uniref:Serine acetyltransferase n=1 Tax=Algoriphagus aquimarinus TaxID=237018 RepID=A0A5C7A7V8_9BACT|nr:serine acetyltransferase [Algoriphagus aquimarinus]TXE02402.1 serine acetyltransferase [Algoriphagus aquimarinus]
MDLKKLIQQDRKRYGKTFFKAIVNPGFRFLVWMRLAAHFGKFHPVGLLSRISIKLMKVRFGLQIPHIAKIGGGLFMGHYGGIVISSEAAIGENCNIAQGVTIGRINKGPKKGAPKIGNRVWVGPNAVLVGNITIGDNVLIAPLCFVNMDVPTNCMVIGNPAKIIEGKTSEDYINIYK